MASADYQHCEVCNCKTFYDAVLDWDRERWPETGLAFTGQLMTLCTDCVKTHRLIVVTQPTESEGE